MSVLAGLPFERWCRLVSDGTLFLRGHVPRPLPGLALAPGPVGLQLVFRGADRPRLVRARLVQADATARELAPDADLEALVASMSDVRAEATGTPFSGLAVELSRDLRLALEPGVRVVIAVETSGEAHALRLCRPLVMRFGGNGMRLEHGAYRRLSRLAAIRLHRAELHPDGEVRLAGRGPKLTDVAVQRGLQLAASRVTRMVREGQRLRSLQPLLSLEAHSSGEAG